jgi:uncharacterized phosphosugar-binding protein
MHPKSCRKRLNEIADIVIDNQGPQGDAGAINGTGLKVGAPSTVRSL